jgi:hypothetical protein
MGLSDWTFYNTGTTALNLANLPQAPVGVRWLHFDSKNPDVGTATMIAVPKNPPYPYKGVTRGYLRTLIRFDTVPYPSAAGLTCMCGMDNMQPGGAGRTGYSAMLEYAGGGNRRIQLATWLFGINGSGGETIAIADNAWEFGVTYALELNWYLDLPVLNGIVLTVKLGTAPDYSNLVPVPTLNEVLLTGPSVHTTAEAVNIFVDAKGAPNLHVYFDQTSLGTQ